MRTKYLSCSFIFLFFLFSTHTFSQSPEPLLKKEIKTTKTTAHKLIAGSRVYMIMPADVEPMDGAAGFLKGLEMGLLVQDMDDASYYATAAFFTKEYFTEKGITVQTIQDLSINGYPAKCVFGKRTEKDNAVALLYGDSSFATIISGFYPSGNKEMENTIIKCLESTWHDKKQALPAAPTALFSVGDNASRFKFSIQTGSMEVYTIGGVELAKDAGVPQAIISPAKTENMTGNLLVSYAKGVFDSYSEKSGSDFVKNSAAALTINGTEAYEIIATGKHHGQDVLVYTCVFSGNGFTLALVGSAKRDIKATTEDFKLLARAIKLK